MSSPDVSIQEHPVDEAARCLGGREQLARAFGKSLSAIGQWKARGVPIEYCATLERLVPTVTRQRLRPYDFATIWPELGEPADSSRAQEAEHG